MVMETFPRKLNYLEGGVQMPSLLAQLNLALRR